MQEIKLENFAPVTLAESAAIRPLLLAEDVCFCEYSFANLFMWGDIYKTRWLLQEDRLWLYNGHDDLMLMPVGRPLDIAGLVAVSDGLRRAGKSGNFVLVDPDFVQENPDLGRSFNVAADPDNGDYIYLNQKLVDLPGNKLHKKRNLINQFLAAVPRPCRPAAAAFRPGRLPRAFGKVVPPAHLRGIGFRPRNVGLDPGAEPFCRAGTAGNGDLFGRPDCSPFRFSRG